MYPYLRGRCLIWDATCVNTFASLNLIRAALAAGSFAEAAEVRKIAKYADASSSSQLLSRRPAPWGIDNPVFLDLGRRLAERFQDQRESDFLFQRVSLAILMGNAFSTLQSYRDYNNNNNGYF